MEVRLLTNSSLRTTPGNHISMVSNHMDSCNSSKSHMVNRTSISRVAISLINSTEGIRIRKYPLYDALSDARQPTQILPSRLDLLIRVTSTNDHQWPPEEKG